MASDEQLAALTARFGVAGVRTGCVLIVDDEPLNLRVLCSFLEDDYRIVEASSGKEALELARSTPIDVVVTDQRMPGMTGVDLLEKLRTFKPDVAGIVLSGFTDQNALESAINRAAVFRFLKKPFQPAEMLAAVAQATALVVQRRTIEQLVLALAARTEELTQSLAEVSASREQALHLERLGTMGQLAAGVTHDLRNVIVGLRAVELEIAETATSPDLVETLHLGMKGIESLLGSLEAMYQFARSGSMNLSMRTVAPEAVARDALAISRMDRVFRDRVVELDIEPGLPSVRGDQQKLTQVLVNLVRNALQATSDRRLVRVGVRAQGGHGESVLLSVEDEGAGVEESLRERLFQPFVSTKGRDGMGMGLYMARLIVESHDGQISCANRPGGGARFEVSLPALTAAATTAAAAH
jgi:signal transduction histidine kinase